jgi:2-oxo-3-hexenedioate decarboxylase
MAIPDGGTISMSGRCHPRAEPEIAFIMASDLKGNVTDVEAVAAVQGVTAALEIIDSRYRDFAFTLPDVIADNTSASGFLTGSTFRPIVDVNLGNLGIILELNGKVVETGSSAAIYDHPVRSLVELLRMLARRGEGLLAGDVVLAGAATAAVPLKPGDHVRAVVDELGTAEFFVSDRPTT